MPGVDETGHSSQGIRYLLTDWQVLLEPRAAYNHLARQILSTDGLSSASQIQITFHPAFETLTLHSVDIFRDGEWTSRLDSLDVNLLRRETEMERFILDGSYTANFSPTDVRVGDILRYEFTISGSNPVVGERYYGRFPMGWSDPLHRFRARVVSPPGRELKTRSNAPIGNPETRTTKRGMESIWSVDGLPGILRTEGTPAWRTPYPFVEISEYRNWGEVVEWALPLYKVDEPLSRELAQILNGLPGATCEKSRTSLAIGLRLSISAGKIFWHYFPVFLGSLQPPDWHCCSGSGGVEFPRCSRSRRSLSLWGLADG